MYSKNDKLISISIYLVTGTFLLLGKPVSNLSYKNARNSNSKRRGSLKKVFSSLYAEFHHICRINALSHILSYVEKEMEEITIKLMQKTL